MKRFLLADDNPALRSALRLMLETRLNAPLVFEATDGLSLIDQSLKHEPDCLILDWELPGLEVHRDLDALRHQLPEIKIIVTSARPEAAVEAAAYTDAFVAQTDSPDAMLNALHGVAFKPR